MRREQQRPQRVLRPELVRIQPQGRTRPELRPNVGSIQPQYRIEPPRYRAERGNGRYKQEPRRPERIYSDPPVQRQFLENRAWPNNYGYERSTAVRARNADRKALRDQEKYWRNQARNEGRRYNQRSDESYYYERENWRNNVLRSVISNVLYYNSDNYSYGSYTPRYDSYSYGAPYNPDYFYDAGYYPQYRSSHAAPYFYQPNQYSYSSYYDGDPYYDDEYVDNIPIQYLIGSYGGGSYLKELISNLLAYGYESGYRDGLYAREQKRRDRHYDDPFAYEEGVYDPYSYSLGENRQCLSEGYELGYQDALYERAEYDPYQSSGDVDLVSLLIGSVMQM